MITATLKQEKEQNLISWGTPTDGDEVTLSDYRAMILYYIDKNTTIIHRNFI